jgi:hypothetical protein
MSIKQVFAITILILTTIILRSQDNRENEIYEEFALNSNRSEVLKKLIPGTEIYFFLNTLYLQQNNKINEAEEVLIKWQEIFPASEKYIIMKNRQALLLINNQPEKTFAFIKEKLNLNFDIEKPVTSTPQVYPSILSNDIFDVEIRIQEILPQDFELKHFTTQGLFKISNKQLTSSQIETLLNSYDYPDLPNLVNLIIKDFQINEKRNFGDLHSHNILTLNQLNELKKAKPEILSHKNFVTQYLNKSLPQDLKENSDASIKNKKYQLDSWEFAKNLNPSFNTLKAMILYSYLNLCLEFNQPDFNLFHEYLKLPRMQNYANVEFYQKQNLSNQYISYDEPMENLSQFSRINSDTDLVTTYLYALIQSKVDTKNIRPYFETSFFNKFEAETKIKTGISKPEDFYQILATEDLEKLKKSVEISFTKQNKKFNLMNDSITLYLQLKNIPELEIQIFKLNTFDYYRTNLEEIDQDISMEGYIPNYSRKIAYQNPETIRHHEQIELKEIEKPGIYIIELLGNGFKNRTYIRKGNLHPISSNTKDGQEIQLFDDSQNKIINFSVYFGKHQLNSNALGKVKIPFAADKNDSSKKVIISYQDLTCLYDFYHKNAYYSFSFLNLNPPESIIPGQNCSLLIKPVLYLNYSLTELSKIKNSLSIIQFFNHKDELLSSQSYHLDTLKEIMELKAFVPETATRLTIKLDGSILNKADDEKINISNNCNIQIIGSRSQSSILGLYLRKQKDNFQIECLNKAGVPQPNICIYLNFYHQLFKDSFTATLQTDQNGIITLNKLPNINFMSAKIYNGSISYWQIITPYTSRPTNLSALENESLGIPFNIENKNLSENLLLLKKTGNNFLEDKTSQLKIVNDILIIPTESSGYFTLYLKSEDRSIDIKILKGKKLNNYYVTEDSIAEIPAYIPHQIVIEPINYNTDTIKGKVINPNADMKVFLWTGRYYSNLPNFINRSSDFYFQWSSNTSYFKKKPNSYLESIKLSEEQNYILDRRSLKKFPGNLLITPSAILNPWDTASTISISGGGGGGGSFGTRSGGGKRRAVMKGGGSKGTESSDDNSFAFLPNSIIKEIITQADGSFTIEIKDLSAQRSMQIGVISPYGYTIKELPLSFKEKNILNISQQKINEELANKIPLTTLAIIEPNKTLTFLKSEESQYVLIDTISKLNSVLEKIIKNQKFNDFEFLSHWSELTDQQKLAKYQDYACHELHFYIYQKDLPFFNRHIKPFLINKQVKTLIDHWLLDEDISKYLSFNEFNRLNLFEKILLLKVQPKLKNVIQKQIQEFLEINKENKEKELEQMEQILNAEKLYSKIISKNNSTQKDGEKEIRVESEALPPKQKSVIKKSVTLVTPSDITIDSMIGDNDIEIEEEIEDESAVLYRDLKDTKEKAEAYYYQMERKYETIDLIKPSQFWLDYLNHSNASFVSAHILNFTNIHEAILALALMDLPEKAAETNLKTNGDQVTLTTQSRSIVLYNSFKTGVFLADQLTLHQHYFFNREEEKVAVIANKNKFFINKKYNCLTVITNTTSEKKDFNLNYLIPEGSIPLDDSLRNKMRFVSIQPFTSFVVENQFFFPKNGSFSHLPAKANNNDNIFTDEKSYSLTVTSDPETLDKATWEYIIREGNKEKILEYIQNHNLKKINFADIYYLLKDSTFFENLTTELRSRFYFDFNIWPLAFFMRTKPNWPSFYLILFFIIHVGHFFLHLY